MLPTRVDFCTTASMSSASPSALTLILRAKRKAANPPATEVDELPAPPSLSPTRGATSSALVAAPCSVSAAAAAAAVPTRGRLRRRGG